ncbi:MAG TPA: NAD(P)H-dependent glycerol-3-phosphate dehydrogenase [bacterium]|jgi:glycerol-3-phosphate dehydrogenase (NAD(P)+)
MSAANDFDIAVVGAGAWGTTISTLLARNGHMVLLWAYETEIVGDINNNHRNSTYLPDFELDKKICATDNLSSLQGIKKLIIVIPSEFFSSTFLQLREYISPATQVISATKGFIGHNLELPWEMVSQALPENKTGVLSGPNLAREIASGLPAISLIASNDEKLIMDFQSILSSNRFRVYGGTDVIGTGLAGALKNIVAIAAGIVDGMDLGENAMAALITRGLAEIIKLAEYRGGDVRTFYGVSGLGDLICTCQSRLSRNNTVGRLIASGKKLDEIRGMTQSVAEGISTTRHVHEYAMRHELDLPITASIYRILFENVDPTSEITELMTRSLKME